MVLGQRRFFLPQYLEGEEQQTVLDASRYAPDSRFRQRAHAVYLSDKGYRLDQLADIFAVDRDTASAWLTAWDSVGKYAWRQAAYYIA